jgi:hypothetical protein
MKKESLNSLSIPAIISLYPWTTAVILTCVNIYFIFAQGDFASRVFLLPHKLAIIGLSIAIPFIAFYINNIVNSLPTVINKFSEDKNAINEIFSKYKTRVYGSWASYILPIFFAIVGLRSIISLGIPWLGKAATMYEALVCLFLVIVGAIGWHFLNFLLLLRAIGKLNIIGDPFYWPYKYFSILNQKSLEVFGLGAILYLGAIITVWLIPWGTLLLLSGSFSYFWSFPLAAIVLAYFIVSQFYIHNIIKASKENRVEKIDELLGRIFNESIDSKRKSSVDINQLITWRNIVTSEIDWPINIRSNVAIFSAILSPAIGTLIEFMLR